MQPTLPYGNVDRVPSSPRRQYIIRDARSGKILGNEEGYSAKGALRRFVTTNRQVHGDVEVKARADQGGDGDPGGEWEFFTVE